MLHSKQPPVAREFSGVALCFERNCDIPPALYARGGRTTETRNFKRLLKNVGMGGWMEALADKLQGEHIPFHNIATFHTIIPT